VNNAWNYHAGGGSFKNLNVFNDALEKRYGVSASAEEYARKAQVMAYEGHRAMFEAYGRNKYTSTGVIQWMLNNAWPGMIWHLYDWYLRPGGSYFGAKKACEPLHVQYSYDDRSIAVVNSYYEPHANLKVSATAYNLDATVKFTREEGTQVAADGVTRVFKLPEIEGASKVWFLDLKLQDAGGRVVSRNFYWFSTTPETLDWEKTNYYVTPTKTFADYTALDTLPPAELKYTSRPTPGGTLVQVTNAGKSLAFPVHLKLSVEDEEILPVLWDDNYFALLPGETREIGAVHSPVKRGKPVLEIESGLHAAKHTGSGR